MEEGAPLPLSVAAPAALRERSGDALTLEPAPVVREPPPRLPLGKALLVVEPLSLLAGVAEAPPLREPRGSRVATGEALSDASTVSLTVGKALEVVDCSLRADSEVRALRDAEGSAETPPVALLLPVVLRATGPEAAARALTEPPPPPLTEGLLEPLRGAETLEEACRDAVTLALFRPLLLELGSAESEAACSEEGRAALLTRVEAEALGQTLARLLVDGQDDNDGCGIPEDEGAVLAL